MTRTVARLALLGLAAGLLTSGSPAHAITCNPYFPRPGLSVCDVACPVDRLGVFENCH